MAFAFDAIANITKITNCKLYDGSTILTTGSNIVNPTVRCYACGLQHCFHA